jgi:hypothetical protein
METVSKVKEGFNVAKTSTSGHYLKNAVVLNSLEELGTFVCKTQNENESAVLETKNHGVVKVDAPKGFAVFTQVELNNYTKVFEKARD